MREASRPITTATVRRPTAYTRPARSHAIAWRVDTYTHALSMFPKTIQLSWSATSALVGICGEDVGVESGALIGLVLLLDPGECLARVKVVGFHLEDARVDLFGFRGALILEDIPEVAQHVDVFRGLTCGFTRDGFGFFHPTVTQEADRVEGRVGDPVGIEFDQARRVLKGGRIVRLDDGQPEQRGIVVGFCFEGSPRASVRLVLLAQSREGVREETVDGRNEKRGRLRDRDKELDGLFLSPKVDERLGAFNLLMGGAFA